MTFFHDNVGDFLVPALGADIAADSAGSRNGNSLDRIPGTGGKQYDSANVILLTGAVTGTPTDASVDVHLEDSPDNSTWTDYVQPGASSATIIDVNTDASPDDKIMGSASVNLKSAERYVRAVVTVAFTAGTSPTLQTSVVVDFGGLAELPA